MNKPAGTRIVLGLALAFSLTSCGLLRDDPDDTDYSYAEGPARESSVPAAAPAPASAAIDPADYVVAAGDTLYGIAFRRGIDYRDIASWNSIAAPYTIRPGQRLRLRPASASAPASASVSASVEEAAPATTIASAQRDASVLPSAPAVDGSTSSADDRGASRVEATTSGTSDQTTALRAEPLIVETLSAPTTAPAANVDAPAQGTVEPHPTVSAAAGFAAVEPAVDAGNRAASADPASDKPPSAARSGALSQAIAAGAAPGSTSAASAVAPAASAAPNAAPAPREPAPERATAPATPPLAVAKLGPPRSVDGIAWSWPVSGAVVARYALGDAAHQGIEISTREGTPVQATADGEVVYSGNGLVGYGELVIIKHSNEFLSAYGRNRKRLVVEGDRVKAGQAIAEVGRGGSAQDVLHFEIRRAGKPDDPLKYLPPR